MEIVVNLEELVDEIKSELSKAIGAIASAITYGDYLTTQETRAYLGGISNNTLSKLRRQGLPRVTIDGLCLYKKTDIQQFLDIYRDT